MKHLIKLTYFKQSGKFYSEGEYETDKEHMFEVFEEVKVMSGDGNLPGLCEGCGKDFVVHINADSHPVGYPALINVKGN